jgi:hypothetical protein
MKQWLRELFDQYLANVSELTIHDRSKAAAWSGWMKAKWAEKGFQDISTQRPLMDEVRQALEDNLGPDHIALETLKFDTEVSGKTASRTVSRNGKKPGVSKVSKPSKAPKGRSDRLSLPESNGTGVARNGSGAQWTLTTRDAYELARERGYKGTKSQMQKRVREAPQAFLEKYGMRYRPGAVSGRYAKNWSDVWGAEPRSPKPAQTIVAIHKKTPVDAPIAPPIEPSIEAPVAVAGKGDIQTAQELGQALLWFVQEVEQLRQQIQELEGLADAYDVEVNAERVQAYDRLVAENEQLKQEQALLSDKLTSIGQAVQMSIAPAAPAAPAVPAVTPPPATPPAKKRGRPPASAAAKAIPKGRPGRKPKPVTPPPVSTPVEAGLDPQTVRALDAVMNYNNAPGREHHEKWVISYPVMKELLKQVGSSTQPKIRDVFEARRRVIDAHHRQHQLTSRHNRVHGDRSISDVIRLA